MTTHWLLFAGRQRAKFSDHLASALSYTSNIISQSWTCSSTNRCNTRKASNPRTCHWTRYGCFAHACITNHSRSRLLGWNSLRPSDNFSAYWSFWLSGFYLRVPSLSLEKLMPKTQLSLPFYCLWILHRCIQRTASRYIIVSCNIHKFLAQKC